MSESPAVKFQKLWQIEKQKQYANSVHKHEQLMWDWSENCFTYCFCGSGNNLQ